MVALLLGLLVIGTDEIEGLVEVDDLTFLYLVAAVIGTIIGALTGAAGLFVAVLVARRSKGSPANRRLLGALAAAGSSAAGSTLTMGVFFGPGLAAAVAVGALGGVAAWLLLPSQLDLSTEPRPVMPQAQPAAAPDTEVSALNRGVMTLVVAGVGSFLVVNVVMRVVSSVASVKRDAADVLALIILIVAFAVIAMLVWRHLARRQTAAPAQR